MPADQNQRRKVAAILSADVAGYSRLMGEDEAATVARLTAYREIFAQLISRHKGRIVDTAGDSVLATFDSVVEAVECAAEVQRTLHARNGELLAARRMEFRIGVNLGDVIEQADGSIYGDGVNIAARLQALADPGGICISGTTYDQVKNKIALEFDYLGEKLVKNIAEPVRTYLVRSLAGAAARFARPAAALLLPDKPSIAVLPFVNMSGDAEQEYFSDGMTEDVITSLSKLSGLFVIARSSVFTYKGRAVKPQQVSLELGVRYVLEGSVRKAQDHVRITAQLIDATTGYHLWAEHYDGELKDVFTLQDGITRQIVSALAPKLIAKERSLRVRQETNSVEAYDLVLRGISLYQTLRREPNAIARQMYQKAIALDPNYARAYVQLSATHFNDWVYQWTPDPGAVDRAVEAAQKAVALDDSLPGAHRMLGWVWIWKKQLDLGIAELEKAVSLDPNGAYEHASLAEGLNFAGRPDEAIGFVEKAMRLDPNYGAWVVFFLGNSYYLLHRYDEAITAYQEAVRRNPEYLSAHQLLAVAYADLGQEKEARAQAAEVLRINPGYSLNLWRDRLPFKNQADLDRWVSGSRKAGLK